MPNIVHIRFVDKFVIKAINQQLKSWLNRARRINTKSFSSFPETRDQLTNLEQLVAFAYLLHRDLKQSARHNFTKSPDFPDFPYRMDGSTFSLGYSEGGLKVIIWAFDFMNGLLKALFQLPLKVLQQLAKLLINKVSLYFYTAEQKGEQVFRRLREGIIEFKTLEEITSKTSIKPEISKKRIRRVFYPLMD